MYLKKKNLSSPVSVPFQGIQYLVDNCLLEWTPEAVAEFLYKEDGLNKTAIGNFLGERYVVLTKTDDDSFHFI